MTATIADVVLTGAVFQDVYLATYIVLGTPIVVQNKSATTVLLQISATSPDSSSTNGYALFAGQIAYVSNATEGLWAKGVGKIHVEVDV